MALIKRTDGDTGSGENGRPKCNDDTYVQPTTGTTTGASTQSVSVYETTSGSNAGITVTISGDVAPFVEKSKALRKSATGTLIRDLKYGDVIGPYLTTQSHCYIAYDGIYGGLTNSNICVEKFLEICVKMNVILTVIDNDLLNQFSLLTSFHGYDESIQNDHL